MKRLMNKHEDPFHLRGLAPVSPPSDAWPAVEAALIGQGRQRRLRRLATMGVAAAAVVALVLVLDPGGSIGPVAPDRSPSAQLQPSESTAEPAIAQPAAGDSAATRAALIALSQQMEVRLRDIRGQIGGLRSDQLVYRIELEDLIAQVDDRLSAEPDSLGLWSQRVQLLMDLEQFYADSLRREYRRLASL